MKNYILFLSCFVCSVSMAEERWAKLNPASGTPYIHGEGTNWNSLQGSVVVKASFESLLNVELVEIRSHFEPQTEDCGDITEASCSTVYEFSVPTPKIEIFDSSEKNQLGSTLPEKISMSYSSVVAGTTPEACAIQKIKDGTLLAITPSSAENSPVVSYMGSQSLIKTYFMLRGGYSVLWSNTPGILLQARGGFDGARIFNTSAAGKLSVRSELSFLSEAEFRKPVEAQESSDIDE